MLAAGPRARRARAQCVSRSPGSRCRHCPLRRAVQAHTLVGIDTVTNQTHGPQAARAARARGRVAAVHASPCSAKVAAQAHTSTKVGKQAVARGGSSTRARPWPPLQCAQTSAGVDTCGPICGPQPPPQRVHPPRPSKLRGTHRSTSPAAPAVRRPRVARAGSTRNLRNRSGAGPARGRDHRTLLAVQEVRDVPNGRVGTPGRRRAQTARRPGVAALPSPSGTSRCSRADTPTAGGCPCGRSPHSGLGRVLVQRHADVQWIQQVIPPHGARAWHCSCAGVAQAQRVSCKPREGRTHHVDVRVHSHPARCRCAQQQTHRFAGEQHSGRLRRQQPH